MSRQATLNVSLTPTLERYVRAKVKSGRYESASEVIRESLRALQERERKEQLFWAGVRSKVGEARQDVAAGRVLDGEEAMAEILAELEAADATESKPARKRKKR